jgi:hypothetical protein
MKNIVLTLMLIITSAYAFSYPVRVQSWEIARDVKTINALNISIDRVNHQTGTIIADVRDAAEHDLLRSNGIDAVRIADEAREYYDYLIQTTRGTSDPMNQYYSIDEYYSFMQNIAATYPDICQLQQFGSSIQNRPLYIMKISDNVAQNETEPEVKLVASIHGDETVGYDLMLRLIQLLTSQYGTDPRITNIVNNTELWINPLMNPDGYANGVRYNAAGVDLNRNFPMPTGVTNPDGNPTAQENLAMMNFSNQHNFAIGINFHGGALVINYPWDYTYTLAPDDELIQDLALTYSSHNLPMYNSTEFSQGITNGAAWYVITGSMQDWNYGFTSNIELTAEVSNVKWPAASTLDTYWDQNRESILSFIEYAQNGIKGSVTNESGMPIAATIKISGNPRDTQNDAQLGDFHRILLPGTHTVTASSTGYLPQSMELQVPASGFATANFSLIQAQQMTFSGIVRDAEGFPIGGARLILNSDPPHIATSAPDGSFLLPNIFEGDYLLQVRADSQPIFSEQVQLRHNPSGYNLAIVLGETLFLDDFETDLDSWVATSPWGRIQDAGNWVLTDSPAGNYGNNVNRSIRLQNPVSLQNIQSPLLSFRAKWDLEAGYDYVYVEGSTNGSTWTQIASFTGSQDTWTDQYYALSAYAGQDFHLRFRLISDWSETADGIYIDDVQISGRNIAIPLWGDADSNGIIDSRDLTAVLEHCVGNHLTPEQALAANVDALDAVNSFDAYQIYLYIIDPTFRFPVQSLQNFSLPEITLDASLEGNILSLAIPEGLRSLQLNSPHSINALNMYFPDSSVYHALNAQDGLFSMISPSSDEAQSIAFVLGDPAFSFEIAAIVNGHHSIIEVNPSSSDDALNPTIPLRLFQNHPNPFNPETQISFSLPEKGEASIKVFNLKGQLVQTLSEGAFEQGLHRVMWNGKDDRGRPISSGIYFYRLETESKILTRKMVLSK